MNSAEQTFLEPLSRGGVALLLIGRLQYRASLGIFRKDTVLSGPHQPFDCDCSLCRDKYYTLATFVADIALLYLAC